MKGERKEYYIVVDRVSRMIKGYPVFSYEEAEKIKKTAGESFVVEKRYRWG